MVRPLVNDLCLSSKSNCLFLCFFKVLFAGMNKGLEAKVKISVYGGLINREMVPRVIFRQMGDILESY
jgi:hypothetical protein